MVEVPARRQFGLLEESLRERGHLNLLARELDGLFPAEDVRQDGAEFAGYLAAHGIRHEDKPIPFESRPYLIRADRYEHIVDRFRLLNGLVERVIDRYLADPEVRRFFRLAPRHDRLVRLGAAYRPFVQYCRYDFTLGAGPDPRVYELNTHSPAAATYAPHFADMLATSRVMNRLTELGVRTRRFPLEEPGAFARAVLVGARRHLGGDAGVAVLNSRYLTMHTELDHIAAQFREQGVPAVRGYVEDLRFDGSTLWCGDQPVRVTYNKFDDSHGPDAFECAFSRTTEEVRHYLDAYRAGSVFAVNSFPSMYLPEQKSTLAFLCSPLMREHMTREERDLVAELVPFTRLVRHLGEDELAEAARDRPRYVLKRSMDTRGRSLVIGHASSGEEWRRALAAARDEPSGDDYVIQELAPAERCVLRHEGTDRQVFTTLSCFLFSGEPVGLIVRTSADETTNVGRAGFMQAPLLVEEHAWTR